MPNSLGQEWSREQILCGLRIVVHERMGCVAPFEEATPLAAYLRREGADGLFLITHLEDVFGLERVRIDWESLFTRGGLPASEWEKHVEPALTFGVLAEFIRREAPIISFESVAAFGEQSPPVGVFLGLETLARDAGRLVRKIGPGETIQGKLSGHRLHSFWDRLRWMTDDSLPPLPRRWLNLFDWSLADGFLSCLSGFGLLAVTGQVSFLLLGILYAGGACCVARLIVGWANPLPPGCRTFADLARQIARKQTLGDQGTVYDEGPRSDQLSRSSRSLSYSSSSLRTFEANSSS